VHNGPVLGSGISGLVRLVTHKATGLKYAVKVLDLGLVDTTEGLRQLREEIFIMCQLDHPNIVRLEEVYESTNEIYLVQELCVGGELFDRLDEQPDYHYTEAECARLVKHMLSAVRYLHSKGIIHRDLKLENFLFSSTAKDSELKMIDFGLSKHFRYGEMQHEAVGTPYTVAPEVIRGSYDERCDIWAIGVITFLLLSGEPPFGGCGGPEPMMTVRSNILGGIFKFEPEDIWDNVSPMARNFIKAMLVTDPKRRPTAREAQRHQWLQEWTNRSRVGADHVLNPNVVKALVNFKEYSDMRKLLCEVLSFTLLPDQIKDLRREFEKMDTDGSGEISLSALKQVLMTNAGAGSLGALTEEEVTDIFNAMRVRKTETRIHWHEFIAAGLSQCQVDDRNLRLAFERLDSDHKGVSAIFRLLLCSMCDNGNYTHFFCSSI
jgi:calcium-dependent protein kinase